MAYCSVYSTQQITELADSCRQYVLGLSESFKDIGNEYLMEKILSAANYANYSVKYDVVQEEVGKVELKVWEMKDESSLVELSELSEVSKTKKLRTCYKRILEHLVKLIKLIDKV